MCSDRHQLQVLNPVVGLDAVDVVNVLIIADGAPDVLFHDDAMFKEVMPVGAIKTNVSALVDTATALPTPAACSERMASRIGTRPRTIAALAIRNSGAAFRKDLAAVQTRARHWPTIPPRVLCAGRMAARVRACAGAVAPAARCDSTWTLSEMCAAGKAGTINGHWDQSSQCRAEGVPSTARLSVASNYTPTEVLKP